MARGHALSEPFPDRFEAGWRATRLQPDVEIIVSDHAAPFPDDATADAIWAEAVGARPSLFDGRVFVADTVAAKRISGSWTRYSRVFAQLRRPDLFEPPHLRALSVNGLLSCPDGIVLGLRRAEAVYRPNCWQGVPAGSVEARDASDAVSVHEQVLAELWEEIGLSADAVDSVVAVVAMEHPGGRVLDIGCLLTTHRSFGSIERSWRECGNKEYAALKLVPDAELSTLLEQSGPDLLVSARILLAFRSSRFGEQ